MRNYTAKIARANLRPGAYYTGRCRNATLARWSAEKGVFIHWRTKFGHRFLEEIKHPEDEQYYDVFVVEAEAPLPAMLAERIPFDGDAPDRLCETCGNAHAKARCPKCGSNQFVAL